MRLIPGNYFTGCDAILLGAETLRGLYPVETISTVGKICAEVCVHDVLIIRYLYTFASECIDTSNFSCIYKFHLAGVGAFSSYNFVTFPLLLVQV